MNKVFIASMLDHKPELINSILAKAVDYGCAVTYYSEADASSEEARTTIADEVRGCDCFVVILDGTYGSLLPDCQMSVGHEQVTWAIEAASQPDLVRPMAILAFQFMHDPSLHHDNAAKYNAYQQLIEELDFRGVNEVANNHDVLFFLGKAFQWLFQYRLSNEKIVLLSSTFKDLAEERKAVQDAATCRMDEIRLFGFEVLPKGLDPKDTSLRLAQKACLYLGLLSDYRGTAISEVNNETFTELEYREALKAGCPIVLFNGRLHRAYPTHLRQSHEDLERAQKFNNDLIEAHQERPNEYFEYDDLSDLRNKVQNALLKHSEVLTRFAGISETVATTTIPALPEPYFVHEYNLAVGSEIVGRDDELRELNGWIHDARSPHFSKRVLCIEALGGMGKSALAWKWVTSLGTDFQAIVWYSFYSVESGMMQFAESVLPYLRQLPGAEEIARLDISPLEKVMQITERCRVLLVLDGLERRMKLYTDFGARAAEGDRLQQFIEERIERHRLAFAQHPEDTARELARRECFALLDGLGDVLKRLANCRQSRVLITSRFFPSDLEDEGVGTEVRDVGRILLEPLNRDEAAELAACVDVAWDNVFDLLHTRVGGYPLYLALAFDYVGRVEPGLATERARKDALARVLTQHIDNARTAVLSLGMHHLSEEQREVLFEIEACPIASHYRWLEDALVGENGVFSQPSDLLNALRHLHARKLIGWDASTGSCDMHPVVREAVRLQGTPELIERLTRRHPTDVPSVNWGDRLRPRVSDILRDLLIRIDLELRCGEPDKAAQIYLQVVDPLFRYHSAEIDMRHEYLERFRANWNTLSDRSRCRVLLNLADSALLRGDPSKTEQHGQRALQLARAINDDELIADASYTLAMSASNMGRLYEADLRLLDAIQASKYNTSQYATRWILCSKARMDARIGKHEQARQLLDYLRHHYGEDADILGAEYAYACDAIARGQTEEGYVEDLLARHHQQCMKHGLYYGYLAQVRMAAICIVHDEDGRERIRQLSETLADQANAPFLEMGIELRAYLARYLAITGQPNEALSHARHAREEASRCGLFESEIMALIASAEAYLSLAGTNTCPGDQADYRELARHHAHEAACMANADGAPYCFTELQREVEAIYKKMDEQVPQFEPCSVEMMRRVPDLLPVPPVSSLPAGITNIKGWTDEQVRVRIEEVKTEIDWADITDSARKWWEAFEHENQHRIALVLRLAEELQIRKATITEFFLAYVYSNTDNIQANLHYLDYTRLKKADEARKNTDEATETTPSLTSAEMGSFCQSEAHLTDIADWSDDRIRDLLAKTRTKLDWENTTGSARKWWEAFESENQHRLALVLRLAEELLVRKATISEFFLAYVYSNTDNIQANLHYLDYTRLKKEEERKRRETQEAAGTLQ